MECESLRKTALLLCQLDPEKPVLVGVSGGPDSLCLLDALARSGFTLVAAHFDHQLRPESGQEAAQVQSAAVSLGASFTSGSASVAGYARENRLSLEEAARELRYRFLFDQARRFACQAVAVGHTADDQVETVLLHLLRGSGLGGLLGMRYRSLMPDWDARIPLVRPLLDVWRAETLAYCQERGLRPVFDPTNQDTAYSRNRIRHEIIPALEAYQPQARQNLWRMAQILAGDEEALQAAADQAWQSCLAEQRPGYVALHQEAFLALPVGLQRRVLRRAVGDRHDVDFEMIEASVRFATRLPDGVIHLGQGLRFYIDQGRLVIARSDLPLDAGWPQLEQAVTDLPIPGEVRIAPGWRLALRWVEPPDLPRFPESGASAWEAWIDADALGDPLGLRRSRPGDRFQPLGMEGQSLKLSDFWINEKLPRRARAAWPLLAAGDAILWVPGYRLAHPYRLQKNTRRALHVRLYQVKPAGSEE